MSKITLYGRRGWGSTIVEAQLGWLGLDYTYEAVGDLLRSAEARSSLAPVNPLTQVPTLVLPTGQILTESAAITLYLADMTGSEELVPPPSSAERPDFLRWLIFLVANVGVRYILDRPAVAGVIVGARLGVAQHLADNARVFDLALDDSDHRAIEPVLAKSRELIKLIGDCGDEYR